MKIAAIIQARMGSTRLRGKVLRKLGDTTVLGHVVRRVSGVRLVDDVVVASTELSADDAIAEEAKRLGAKVFRGSEDDVLSRYAMAARKFSADIVVRVTSDCPLIDPGVIDSMLEKFIGRSSAPDRIDYLSNTVKRTFPRGLDAEIVRFDALERAHQEAREPFEREHVTPYIYGHPDLFRIDSFTQSPDRSSHRWTLDTEDDWRFLEALFRAIGDRQTLAATADVLRLLDLHPELVALNAHVEQKAIRA